MKTWTLVCLTAITCGAACAAEPRVEQPYGRVEHVTFDSAVLGREMAFSVVLPEGYDPRGADWPVLFMLHGLGRHERTLIDDEPSRQILLDAQFVTVLPRGRNCWYIDAPGLPEDRYETYTKEVIALAERRYRISTERDRRAIGGWSAGGYGSARFAERHPDQFTALGTIIGLLDFPRNDLPGGRNFKIPTDRFTDDPAVWKQFNPLYGAEALRGMDVLIVAADRATDFVMNEHFAKRLDELSIPYTWRVIEGGHTFEAVQAGTVILIEHMTTVLTASTNDKTPPNE